MNDLRNGEIWKFSQGSVAVTAVEVCGATFEASSNRGGEVAATAAFEAAPVFGVHTVCDHANEGVR